MSASENKKLIDGFTLIELLIVVAIIAILAAIAVPNFLEAQTRAKVSRAKADMRSITSALESYCVDYHRYPATRSFCTGSMQEVADYYMCPMELTSPIAYLSIRPRDVFNGKHYYKYVSPGFGFANGAQAPLAIWVPCDFPDDNGNPMTDIPYISLKSTPVLWALWSVGAAGDVGFWEAGMEHHPVPRRVWYDPTNGTISHGLVVRLSTGEVSP